jgi:multimeric flavodoxin WrbA
MRAHGAQVDTVHVKDLKIDHFTLDCYKSDYPHEDDFRRIQRLVEECHGIVIASPIWNFSVPAHMKNLIDRMGSFALDETRSKGTLGGKPFYLIFTGGSPMPVWTGLLQMTMSSVREALRYFGATPMGTHYEAKCMKGRGVFGIVVDQRPESIKGIREKGGWFAGVVRRYAETGELPKEKKAFAMLYKMGNFILKRM